MKKIILLGIFCIAGYATASTCTNKAYSGDKKNSNTEGLLKRDRIEYGLGYVDEADGSCIYYGTYINGDNGVSIFQPASLATNYILGLPKCTGEGSYLA